MTIVAATVALLMLLALAAFQAVLIAGMPVGHFAWGGQHRVLPPRLRIGSAASIVIYAVFAAIIALTMYVTYVAAKRVKSASDFYTAGGGVTHS